jgi:PBP1b-binding outer membrane lipoprotein LpoB
MTRLRILLLLAPLVFFQVGCSSAPDQAAAAQSVDANGNSVSSVPWNKPESWETDGQLGGMTH